MYGCLGGEIIECYENTFYKVNFSMNERIPYSDKTKVVNKEDWFLVYDLYSINNKSHDLTRNKNWKDELYINSNKKEAECFFRMYLEDYLNLNPDYQRNLIWDLEQKQSLIESIFSLKNTGSLTIIQDMDYNYEVLDGKQRLSTIFDFMMDKFKYRDVYFSELDIKDRRTIEHHQFQYSQIQLHNKSLTTKEKVELFIDFNTKGTAVSINHINELKNKYIK